MKSKFEIQVRFGQIYYQMRGVDGQFTGTFAGPRWSIGRVFFPQNWIGVWNQIL